MQAALALTLLISLALLLSMIEMQKKIYELKEVKQNPSQEITSSPAAANAGELESFTREYLEKFFAVSLTNIDWISKQSSAELFEQEIKSELEQKLNSQIKSELVIDDLFIEESDKSNEVIATIFAREKFENSKYLSRDFKIQILINAEEKKVTAIPLFRVL